MSNFANIASEMLRSKAAVQIQNQTELLDKVEYFLSKKGQIEAKTYQNNALAFVGRKQQILSDYLAVIKKYLLK
jgi:3-deoxy-D-manno-octulosonic-acid transferase